MGILYFPTVNIPLNDWFKTAFLFHDKILTIVPPNFMQIEDESKYKEEKLKDFASILEDKKYIQKISSFRKYEDIKAFELKMEPTLDYIEKNIAQFRAELCEGKTFRILHGKFSNNLINRLDKMNLVTNEHVPMTSSEYNHIIPRSIAQVFIYQLALTLGELNYCSPSTDKREYTFEFQQKNNPLLGRQKYFEIVIPKIFPIPEKFDLEQLINLKEKFSTKLQAYKINLDLRVDKLKNLDDKNIEDYLHSEIKEITFEVNKLIELYHEVGVDKFTFSDLKNIFTIIKGFILRDSLTSIKGIWGGINRNKIPESKNPLTFPAIYNYRFNK